MICKIFVQCIAQHYTTPSLFHHRLTHVLWLHLRYPACVTLTSSINICIFSRTVRLPPHFVSFLPIIQRYTDPVKRTFSGSFSWDIFLFFRPVMAPPFRFVHRLFGGLVQCLQKACTFLWFMQREIFKLSSFECCYWPVCSPHFILWLPECSSFLFGGHKLVWASLAVIRRCMSQRHWRHHSWRH